MALLLAAVPDRPAPLRALDRRRLALGAPPRLRRVPDLGAVAGDRGGQHVDGRVTAVALDARASRWLVEVEGPAGTSRHAGGALVLTGPGVHRAFPHEPGVAAAGLPLRQQAQRVRPPARGARVRRRRRRRRRERAQLRDVPARLPAPRPLHRLHADAADEPRRELPREPRLLQPRRGRMGARSTCRRGATSSSTPTAASSTRRAWRRSPTTTAAASSPAGSPTSARAEAARGCGSSTSRRRASPAREHEYVVNCTGFDLLAQLRDLFPAPLRARGREPGRGRSGTGRAGTEVRIGRALELEGMEPRLHIPGLGGLSQGPGLRQPRRPRPALQPGAAAAAPGKVLYAGIWRRARVCNINLYRLSKYEVFQSNRGELT